MGSLTLAVGSFVYIDSAVLIYMAEKHPAYAPCLQPLWVAMASGTSRVMTSELTRLEVLVRPLRLAQPALVAEYRRILTATELAVQPITRRVLDEAAQFRANHHALRTPDAIHVATAIVVGCGMFLTNDRRLKNLSPVPVTLLDDVLAAP